MKKATIITNKDATLIGGKNAVWIKCECGAEMIMKKETGECSTCHSAIKRHTK